MFLNEQKFILALLNPEAPLLWMCSLKRKIILAARVLSKGPAATNAPHIQVMGGSPGEYVT